MNGFKRIEIWILLLLVIGGLVYVLTQSTRTAEPNAEDTDEASAPASSDSVTVKKRELTRDYGNFRLDVVLSITNKSDEPLRCLPPKVRLETGRGETVPEFILATSKIAEIAPGKRSTETLKYWLEKEHLNGSLILKVLDETIPLKSDDATDPESFENGKTDKITSLKW